MKQNSGLDSNVQQKTKEESPTPRLQHTDSWHEESDKKLQEILELHNSGEENTNLLEENEDDFDDDILLSPSPIKRSEAALHDLQEDQSEKLRWKLHNYHEEQLLKEKIANSDDQLLGNEQADIASTDVFNEQ